VKHVIEETVSGTKELGEEEGQGEHGREI